KNELFEYMKKFPDNPKTAPATSAPTIRTPNTRANAYVATAASTNEASNVASHTQGDGANNTGKNNGSNAALCMFAASGAPAAPNGSHSAAPPWANPGCTPSAHGRNCHADAGRSTRGSSIAGDSQCTPRPASWQPVTPACREDVSKVFPPNATS